MSTADQDASLHRDALSRHGCGENFTEVGSGSWAHCPELDRLWGRGAQWGHGGGAAAVPFGSVGPVSDRPVGGSTGPRGQVGGRTKKLTERQTAIARSLYESKEMTVTEIGRVLGSSLSTICRVLDSNSLAN